MSQPPKGRRKKKSFEPLLSHLDETRPEAGLDEVGRGCLAGPVVAAAVVLPKGCAIKGLTDSKLLGAKTRERLAEEIREIALDLAIGEASPAEIDEVNIVNATYLAMHRALDKLTVRPELLLVDGSRFAPYRDLPQECIVKGDQKLLPIAAASVLAKTYRDALMHELAERFPEYGWQTNVGYPTRAHRSAIERLGPTPWHRRTFKLLAD